MATLKLESKKASLARKILNMDDETLLDELAGIIESFNPVVFPCQYSIENLKTGIPKFLNDIKTGKTVSHAQIKRK
ncbi:hypothetical protein D0T84_14445 [Dysgonomonas sp. 521]|uniref:hypothetical protein n=1 Tax=Dysgonomonas sp. 521 TaxID=2302932 RepID=UPI0013D0BC05|nr:hypothetical protein [Dysgonomonas sp. 521]NDV96102.1 hypothetical protein [Dysgonomonas sp. 521]